MANRIKVMNMEIVFETLCNSDMYKSEEELEQICIDMEEQEEFKNLFFYFNGDNEYYYQESNEQDIKDYMAAQNIDISVLGDESFKDYGQELWDMRECNDIEIETYLGTLSISEDAFVGSLQDEFLGEDDYINRLVNAEDFEKEMHEVKKECLEYLIDTHFLAIKQRIKFDDDLV